MVLSSLSLSLAPSAAHAADLSANLELAKKTIQNVAPVVSTTQVDAQSASLAFAPDDYVQKPLITETQITIESAPKPVKKVAKVTSTPTSVVNNTSKNANIDATVAHNFPYGYCTYYVASRRFVPWSGNAITWLAGARAFGFTTGSTPQTGAILVTSEGGRTGHVAMVDSVNADGSFVVSEMNYAGWGKITSRLVDASYKAIMGFIY